MFCHTCLVLQVSQWSLSRAGRPLRQCSPFIRLTSQVRARSIPVTSRSSCAPARRRAQYSEQLRCCLSSALWLLAGQAPHLVAPGFCQTPLGADERCLTTLFKTLFRRCLDDLRPSPQMCRSSCISTGRKYVNKAMCIRRVQVMPPSPPILLSSFSWPCLHIIRNVLERVLAMGRSFNTGFLLRPGPAAWDAPT